MFNSEYDVFFGAQDQQAKYVTGLSSTLSNYSSTYTSIAEGFFIYLTSSVASVKSGDIINLSEGSNSLDCEVKFIDNANNKLFIVPRQDVQSKHSPIVFNATTTTVKSSGIFQDIFSLPIDLSECTDEWNQYVILVYCDLSVSTHSNKVNLRVARHDPGGLPREFYSFARYSLTSSSSTFDEKYAYNAAFTVSLRGGSTNIFTIQGSVAATATAKFRHPRIAAIRAPNVASNGYPILTTSSDYEETNWRQSTTSTSDVTAASFSLTESGKYLLIASRNLSAASSVEVNSKVKVDATTYDDIVHTGMGDASNRHTEGFVGYFDTATDLSNPLPVTVALTFKSNSGASVNIDCPFIAAIKIGENTEEIGAPFMALLGAKSAGDISVTSGNTFTAHPSLTIRPVDSGFNELRGIELYSSDIRKTGTGWEAVPVFSNDALTSNSPTAYSGNSNNAYNVRGAVGTNSRRQRMFWFQRLTWNGYSAGTIKVRAFPTTDANSVVCKDSYAAACLEKLQIPAREGIPTEIIGEFEYGAVISDWASASSYYTGESLITAYKKNLAGVFDNVTRVVVNGADLIKKPSAFLTERNYGSFAFSEDESSAKLSSTSVTGAYTLDSTGFDNISVSSATGFQVGQRVLVINPNNKKKFYHGIITIINGALSIGVRRLERIGDIKSGFNVAVGWKVTGVEGKSLYVNMPEGISPFAESTGNRVIAIGKKRFAREITEVYEDGLPIATDTRLTKLPTVSQNLDIRGSQIKSTQSFNSIELSNGDGIYDSLPGKYIMEGMGIKIYRSWRNNTDSRLKDESRANYRKRMVLYRSLGYYETLIDGVQSAPEFSPGSFRINVLPKILASSKPMVEMTGITFSGNSDNSNINRNANFPVIYGLGRRVEAKRISPITSTEIEEIGDEEVAHFYRVACHEIYSVSSAFSGANTTYDFVNKLGHIEGSLSYTSTELRELLKRGVVAIKNKYITSFNSHIVEEGFRKAPDSIFLDVLGRTDNGENIYDGGKVVTWPGEIAEHILKTYPCESNLAVANSTTLTTMATSIANTITSSLNSNAIVRLKVADRTGFLPGDKIKVTDTTVSQKTADGISPYFWAVVVDSYDGSAEKIIDAWPILEPGDFIDENRTYPATLSPAVSASNVTVERYVSPSLYSVRTYLTNSINDKEPDPDQEFPIEVNSTSGFVSGSEIQVSYGSNKFHARVSSVSSSSIMRISPYPRIGDNLDGKIDYTASSSTYIRLLSNSPAAISETNIDMGSIRQMDHSWRKKLVHNYGALQEDTVQGTFVFSDPKAAIKEFIDRFSKTFFSYSYVNRAGKISLKPVGFEELNLVKNGGFESDVYSSNGFSLVYPFFTDDGYNGETSGGVPGAAAASTSLIISNRSFARPAYEGKRSLRIGGGNNLALSNRSSNAYTSVLLSKPGWYYLSCKSLGDTSSTSKRHLRMSISLPGDGYKEAITSPPISITAASTAAVVWLQPDRARTDFTDSVKTKANVWLQADKMNQDYSENESVYHLTDYSSFSRLFNNYSKWSETTTSGLTQWHRSNDLTTSGAISSWVDSATGATPSLIQTVPQQKPSVSTGVRNGRSALTFTGSQVLLYSNELNLGTTHSIIVVISPDVVVQDFVIFSNTAGTTYFKYVASTSNLVYCLNGTTYLFSWTPTKSTYYVISINRYSTTKVRVLVNGTELNDRTISNSSDSFAIKYVGAASSTGTTGLTGKILEIIHLGADVPIMMSATLAMGYKFDINTEPTASYKTSVKNSLDVIEFDSVGKGPGSTYKNFIAIDNNDTDEGLDLGSLHTITFVFKPVSIGTTQYFLGNVSYTGSSGDSGSHLSYISSGSIRYQAGSNAANMVTFSNSLTANTWYIMTITRDEDQVSLYVNGSLISTQTIPSAGEITAFKFKSIGAANITGVDSFSFQLAEIFITKQSLSTQERNGLEYYLSQKWGISGPTYPSQESCYQLLDYSGNNNHFTIDGYWTYYQESSTGWWKADAISSLSNDQVVGSWSDSSGNARTLSQSTEASKPTYVGGSDGGVNGKPVISFDGTSDYLTLSSGLDLGTSHIVTIVFRYNSTLGANAASNTARNLLYGSSSTAGIDLFSTTIRYSANDGNASGTTTWSPTKNKWYILSFKRLTASPATVAVYLNGTRLTNITLTGANTSSSFTFNTVGRQNTVTYANPYFGGQIAEIITTTTDVDDLKVFQTQSYLARKYNITDTVPMPILTYDNQNGLSTLTIDNTGGIGTTAATSYYDNLSSPSTSTSKNASIDLGLRHSIMVLFNASSYAQDVYLCRGETKESLIYISGSGASLNYKLTDVDTETLTATASPALATNRWYLLTIIRDHAFVYFYLDGNLVSKKSFTKGVINTSFYIKSLACKNQGSFDDGSSGITGNIAEFYAADRVLTVAQRAELENAIMYKWGLSYSNNETSSNWVKNELLFYLEPGEVGNAILRFYPQYNSYTAESHYIDNIELYHISGVLTDATADFKSVDNEDENFYQIEVPYLVSNTDENNRYTMIVRDFDAYGLSNFLYSEAKGAVPSSGILKVDNINLKDADSARGIGAAYARFFGRVRQAIKVTVLDMARIPSVGDKICIKMSRAPVSVDDDNIWTIISVQVSGDMARKIDITAIRQVDPWIDRNKRSSY